MRDLTFHPYESIILTDMIALRRTPVYMRHGAHHAHVRHDSFASFICVTWCFIRTNLSSWRTRLRRVAHTYAWRTHTRMPQPRRTWFICAAYHIITAFICATCLIRTIHMCDMMFHIVNNDILSITTIISIINIITFRLCDTSCICATCCICIVRTCDTMFHPYSNSIKKIHHF